MLQIVKLVWGCVDPKRLLRTGIFDMARAEEHPKWLKEASVGEHTPKMVKYNISSVTFRSQKPFNVPTCTMMDT